MKTEIELIQIAQDHPDEDKANAAMRELRSEYDETYHWCLDCDGLVTKEAGCCLNLLKEIEKKVNKKGVGGRNL
jgi:hypothetical protein